MNNWLIILAGDYKKPLIKFKLQYCFRFSAYFYSNVLIKLVKNKGYPY